MSTNTALALTVDEFGAYVKDFQRTNLFSMHFATRPSAKSTDYLNSISRAKTSKTDTIKNVLEGFGITNTNVQNAIYSITQIGTQKIIRKSGVSKYMIGAMSNRVVQSLLGELNVGTYLIDYFNEYFPTSGLFVQSCKIPDNHVNYEMDRVHAAPTLKITGRDFDPLVVTFRMDSESNNYRAMNDWVNAVEDPITGHRALPVDVEADIQINLHSRNGRPHTAYLFSGCVPVIVSGPQLSYEDNNQITTFDVTYAYRAMSVGAVKSNDIVDWLGKDGPYTQSDSRLS